MFRYALLVILGCAVGCDDGGGADVAPTDMTGTDMAAIDMTATDMAAVDMAAIDMAAIDMAAIDMAAIDMAAIDMAAIDMTATDMTAVDMAAIDMAATDMTAVDMAAIDMAAIDMAAADMAVVDLGLACAPDRLACEDRCQRERPAENCADGCCPRLPFAEPQVVDLAVGAVHRLAIPALDVRQQVSVHLDAVDQARCPFSNFSARLVHVAEQDTIVGDVVSGSGLGRVGGCRTLLAIVEAGAPYALRIENLGAALQLSVRITHQPLPPVSNGDRLAGAGLIPRVAQARGDRVVFDVAGPVRLRAMSRSGGPDAPGGTCAPQAIAVTRADDAQGRAVAAGGGICGSFEAVLGAGDYRVTARANQVDLPAHETLFIATPLDWRPVRPPAVDAVVPVGAFDAFDAERVDLDLDDAGTLILRLASPWDCDGPLVDAHVAPWPAWPTLLAVETDDGCWQAYVELAAGQYRLNVHGPRFGPSDGEAAVTVQRVRRLADINMIGDVTDIPGLGAGGIHTGRSVLGVGGGDWVAMRDGQCVDDLGVQVRSPTGVLLGRSEIVNDCSVLRLPRGAQADSQIIAYHVDGGALAPTQLVRGR